MFRLPLPLEFDKEPKEINSIIKIRDRNPSLENRLVLMPRDPNTIFAYYDFSGQTLRELKKGKRNEAYIGINSEDEKRIFFDVRNECISEHPKNNGFAHCFFDVNNERTMNYYFTGLKPGTKYQAGMHIPRIGVFIRSNIIETPFRPELPIEILGKPYFGP